MQTTIPHFLFQNHVLHPLIKRFDPYIEGVQFVVSSAYEAVDLTSAITNTKTFGNPRR